MSWTVRELAERLGLEVSGVGGRRVRRVASLEGAEPDCLSFLVRAAESDRLARTRAGAVVVPPELASLAPCAAILSMTPYASYARAAQLLHPLAEVRPGIGGQAVVAADAEVDDSAQIDSGAVVGPGAAIGAGVVIQARCFVGSGAKVGAGSRLGVGGVVADDCVLGARCLVQPGAVIGSDGFGYAPSEQGWIRIPQVGRVVVGDDVAVGANTTIDRGAADDTVIGDGVILDNQIQIAHNVRVGERTAMAGCVGVAGSAVIGRRCTLGGAAVVLGHLEIVDDVHITAMSLVTRSIGEPGTYSSGVPLEPNVSWRRNAARFRQLDELARRLRALERSRPGPSS